MPRWICSGCVIPASTQAKLYYREAAAKAQQAAESKANAKKVKTALAAWDKSGTLLPLWKRKIGPSSAETPLLPEIWTCILHQLLASSDFWYLADAAKALSCVSCVCKQLRVLVRPVFEQLRQISLSQVPADSLDFNPDLLVTAPARLTYCQLRALCDNAGLVISGLWHSIHSAVASWAETSRDWMPMLGANLQHA